MSLGTTECFKTARDGKEADSGCHVSAAAKTRCAIDAGAVTWLGSGALFGHLAVALWIDWALRGEDAVDPEEFQLTFDLGVGAGWVAVFFPQVVAHVVHQGVIVAAGDVIGFNLRGIT